VQAADLGVDGTILPDQAEAHPDLVRKLEKLRRMAAVTMSLATDEASVPEAVPKILMVSRPSPYSTLSREKVDAESTDLIVVTFGHGMSSRYTDHGLAGDRCSSQDGRHSCGCDSGSKTCECGRHHARSSHWDAVSRCEIRS
jgi:hypothetical protein